MPTRRQFLTHAAGTGAALVLAPQALGQRRGALLRGGSFAQGVLSGDPTPTGITLWTALQDVSGSGRVALEVARDRGFRRVVARETITTRSTIGHTVKARVNRLEPGERYYYRFETRDEQSPVGRFQTAFPPDSREKVRFAFVSCQEYTFGFFNAHRVLAREDVDFVVNLGDYIYSDVALEPPNAVRAGNFEFSPGTFSATTLDQYRERYRVYRSDSDLRAVHARFPMISTWSDHEVQNNYAGGDPSGGAVTGDAYSRERRQTGYRAFFESMPHFPVRRGSDRLYHRASFGRLVDLFVLDERQYRAAQPCGDRPGPPCGDLNDARSFLGASQLAFARSDLRRSHATWKVIANELPIMPIKLDDSSYDGYDAWQGYPVEREALLRAIDGGVEDVIFVTGDYHAFIAGNVRMADGTTVAAEFVGGSISSLTEPELQALLKTPGWGTADNPQIPPEEQARRVAANPWFAELDYTHHGYAVCEAAPNSFKTTFRKLETVRRRSSALIPGRTYTVHRGVAGIARPRSG